MIQWMMCNQPFIYSLRWYIYINIQFKFSYSRLSLFTRVFLLFEHSLNVNIFLQKKKKVFFKKNDFSRSNYKICWWYSINESVCINWVFVKVCVSNHVLWTHSDGSKIRFFKIFRNCSAWYGTGGRNTHDAVNPWPMKSIHLPHDWQASCAHGHCPNKTVND